MRLDLTRKTPPSLGVTHEPTGDVFVFEFKKIFTRQQRAYLQKTVGKGSSQREVVDLRRMFSESIQSISSNDFEVDGQKHSLTITDPKEILQLMDTAENMGGLPEDVVKAVVSHVLGEATLDNDLGNA